MSPWSTGRASVEELIGQGMIARLQGANAGREALMRRARQQLDSASALAVNDPATSYVIAYDAAKHAAMALLAEQDLRPTAEGGHVAMEMVLTAQFQGTFSTFGRLRRRCHELDYPASADDVADTAEARRGIAAATEIVDDADRIVSEGLLTVF